MRRPTARQDLRPRLRSSVAQGGHVSGSGRCRQAPGQVPHLAGGAAHPAAAAAGVQALPRAALQTGSGRVPAAVRRVYAATHGDVRGIPHQTDAPAAATHRRRHR